MDEKKTLDKMVDKATKFIKVRKELIDERVRRGYPAPIKGEKKV
jgi:hypothetical protein